MPTGGSSPQIRETTLTCKQNDRINVIKASDDWFFFKHSKYHSILKKHKHYTAEYRKKWIVKKSTSPRNEETIKRGMEYFRNLNMIDLEKSRAVPFAQDRIMFEKTLRFVKESNKGSKWAFFFMGS